MQQNYITFASWIYINKHFDFYQSEDKFSLLVSQLLSLFGGSSFIFSFACVAYVGFCDSCWCLWHAKGSLKQHRKKAVLPVMKRTREPQIHEELVHKVSR